MYFLVYLYNLTSLIFILSSLFSVSSSTFVVFYLFTKGFLASYLEFLALNVIHLLLLEFISVYKYDAYSKCAWKFYY